MQMTPHEAARLARWLKAVESACRDENIWFTHGGIEISGEKGASLDLHNQERTLTVWWTSS